MIAHTVHMVQYATVVDIVYTDKGGSWKMRIATPVATPVRTWGCEFYITAIVYQVSRKLNSIFGRKCML